MDFHASDPSTLIENVFRRIQTERMDGLDMLNPAVQVVAVEFSRQSAPEDEWLGVLLTPWSLGLLLLPASASWPVPASHERVFRHYPAGDFAFLANREDELGDYLVCPLFHEMSQFPDQETALATARACLLALALAPAKSGVDAERPASDARRRFLALGR